MGRPINSRYFNETVDNNGNVTDDTKFVLSAKIGINPVCNASTIVKQSSTNRFVVTDGKNTGTCKLVDKAVPDDDEMVISGVINGCDSTVNIRKLHNKTVFDFNNNRYTWEIQNDSTENVLVLFAI